MESTFKRDDATRQAKNHPQSSNPAVSYPSWTIVHAQLEMTESGDEDEREADSVAEIVASGGTIQRKISAGVSSSGVAFPSRLEGQLHQSLGGGQSMPSSLRESMENSFGQDFSQVRLHTDSQAAELSRSISARAFTYGNDVYFNREQYAPGTTEGQRLIAHELTHVVQQDRKVAREEEGIPQETSEPSPLELAKYNRRQRAEYLYGENAETALTRNRVYSNKKSAKADMETITVPMLTDIGKKTVKITIHKKLAKMVNLIFQEIFDYYSSQKDQLSSLSIDPKAASIPGMDYYLFDSSDKDYGGFNWRYSRYDIRDLEDTVAQYKEENGQLKGDNLVFKAKNALSQLAIDHLTKNNGELTEQLKGLKDKGKKKEMNKLIAENKKKISSYKSSIKKNSGKTVSNEKKIARNLAYINKYETRIENIKQADEALRQKMSELDDSLVDLKKQKSQVENKLASLEKQLEYIKDKDRFDAELQRLRGMDVGTFQEEESQRLITEKQAISEKRDDSTRLLQEFIAFRNEPGYKFMPLEEGKKKRRMKKWETLSKDEEQKGGKSYKSVRKELFSSFTDEDFMGALGRIVGHQTAIVQIDYELERLQDTQAVQTRINEKADSIESLQNAVGDKTKQNIQDEIHVEQRRLSDINGQIKKSEKERTSSENQLSENKSMDFSEHASGTAIDINPRKNPFVVGPNKYVGTAEDVFTIKPDSFVVQVFEKYGWGWGGNFKKKQDYMHFEWFARYYPSE